MTKLVKVNNFWKVVTSFATYHCSSTETAAEELLKAGVLDKEIDDALINIYGKEHNVAYFGIKGTFMYSEYSTIN